MKNLSQKVERRVRASGRFTDEEVRQIRHAARVGRVSRKEQARFWGVGLETIARIIRGDTYYWVAEEEEAMGRVEVSEETLRASQERLLALLADGEGEGGD